MCVAHYSLKAIFKTGKANAPKSLNDGALTTSPESGGGQSLGVTAQDLAKLLIIDVNKTVWNANSVAGFCRISPNLTEFCSNQGRQPAFCVMPSRVLPPAGVSNQGHVNNREITLQK
jgi:hypothetical protein